MSDDKDRRRVIVELNPKALVPVIAAYGAFQAANVELFARYTDEQVESFIDFLTRGADVAVRATAEMSRSAKAKPRAAASRAALPH